MSIFGIRTTSHTATIFVLTLLCILLSGCQQPKIASDIATYKKRLANVIEMPLEKTNADLQLGFAEKKMLLKDIPPLEINLREFYGIDACPLKQLIAERNTALGKIALPSQRYKYEVDLLLVLSKCIDKMQERTNQTKSKELAKLTQWKQAKLQVLDSNWSNLLTQSDEFYAAFARAGSFINADDTDAINVAVLDLKYMLSLHLPEQQDMIKTELLAEKSDSLKSIELHLQSMANHQFYARLWRSMIFMSSELSTLNAQLKTNLPSFKCKGVSAKPKFDILRNVFSKYFLNEIQPTASMINHYQYQLAPMLFELSSHSSIPLEFAERVQYHNQITFTQYQDSLSEHIGVWQRFFARCQLTADQISG